MRLPVLTLALAALFPARAFCEDLALQPVIAAALDHGSKVAHAEFKVTAAKGAAEQASGAFDWHATGRAGWARLYYPKVEQLGNGVQVLGNSLQDSWNLQLQGGASKQFRNGIQIQPGITYYPNTSVGQGQSLGQTRPQPNLNLQIPLLHAFDSDNPAAANERASLDEVGGAELERSAARQQATMEAAQTYWRALAATEEEKLLAANVQSSLTNIESLRKLMAAGQISALVLEQALIAHATKDRQLDLVRSEGVKARSALTALLKREVDANLPTLAAAFPNIDALAANTAGLHDGRLVEAALRNRPDLKALGQYVTAAGERLVAARNERDPKINLIIDPNGFFVTFTYDLEGDLAKGAEASAAARRGEAQLNFSEMRDQMRRDVAQGVAALRSALTTLTERRRSQEVLSRVADDAHRAIQTGAMDRQTLRSLEDQRTDAAIALVEARLDVALNLAALRLVTGTLATDGDEASANDVVLLRSINF